ncbi:Transcriptional regulator, AraC family [Nocardiopsis sp. JB363]|nr:Transcriptional regulator, AraC family [Nocardiopsis sp. JB363]
MMVVHRWDLPRGPASALLLVRLGEEHSVPASTVLHGTRVAVDDLEDPHALVGAEQETRIVRNLLGALPTVEALPVLAGSRYHLTTHGVWGFAISGSPDLRSAIRVGLRYLALTWAFCGMSVVEGGARSRLLLHSEHLPLDVRRFFVHRELASIIAFARELGLAEEQLPEVRLRDRPPADPGPRAKLLGPRVRFDAEEDALVLDAAELDRPLPRADAHAAALAEEQCRRLLEERYGRAGVAGLVRGHLMAAFPGVPDLEVVAGRLHVSSRTLRRRLVDEGTSYRVLLDEVREGLAEELFAAGCTVEETGRRLGYRNTPSFTTAFKRWKGMAPRVYLARTRT